jgi:hypothetical protein
MNNLPVQNAKVSTSLSKTPTPQVQEAIQRAAGDKGYHLDSVAYTMQVEKDNLEDKKDIGQATVKMSVSPAWVLNHGGISYTKIARFADDTTSQVLDTQFVGLDSSQNMVFSGTSPGGLSIFALISVKAQQDTASTQTTSESSGFSNPLAGLLLLISVLFILGLWVRKKR